MDRTILEKIASAALAATIACAPAASFAQSPDIARFVGTYDGSHPAADNTQAIELLLYAGGGARLTTTPGITKTAAGTPVWPTVERGTWSVGDGFAIVHLTLVVSMVNAKPGDRHVEDVALSYRLFRCTLTLARDDALLYGKAGIKLHKRNC
jgi:hypothetical protein